MRARPTNLIYLLPAALLLAVLGACSAARSGAARSAMEREADVRKADYVFLEGARMQTGGNLDAYHDLLAHAYQLNPDDKYIGMEYGYMLMRLADGDSAMTERGYELMGEYADANPDDFYGNVLFASVAAHVGDTDRATGKWRQLHEMQPQRSDITMRYAEMLMADPDSASLRRAIELYDSVEIAEGASMQLSARKIQLYYNHGDTLAMMRELQHLIKEKPLAVENNVFAADIYSMLGRRDSALAYYDRAISLDPSNGLTYYSRANFYRNEGDTAAYDREVYNALLQEDLAVEPKLEMLTDYARRLYSDSTQRPRISELFRRLIDLHPHEADIHNTYRDYLLAVEDYAGAAEQASYSLDINPDDERQWVALTALRIRTGDFEAAYDDAMRGIHFFPANSQLYLLGAASLQQLERYDDGLALLARAEETADSADVETMSDILTTRGDIYYAMERTDSAFAFYDRALQFNPLNMTALNNAAYFLACENRDLDRALKLIEQVVAERPDEPTSLDTYAWVLFRRGDFDGARQVIDRTLELEDSPSAELYEHAGDIYFATGDVDEAVEFWREAQQLDPDNDDIRRKVRTRRLDKLPKRITDNDDEE